MTSFSQIGKSLPDFSKYLYGNSASDCIQKMAKKGSEGRIVSFVRAAMNVDGWQENDQIKELIHYAVKQKKHMEADKHKTTLSELKKEYKLGVIKHAEKELDLDPNNQKKQYELAKLHMHNHNHIPALALLEGVDSTVSSKKVKEKIEKCEDKIGEESREIGKSVRKLQMNTKYLLDLESEKIGHGIKKILKKNEDLLPAEASLLKSYTGQFYRVINLVLRKDEDGIKKCFKESNIHGEDQKKVTALVDKIVPIIKHALKKMPSMADAYPNPAKRPILYRGMSVPSRVIEELKSKKTYSDPGFMSTSVKADVAYTFASAGSKKNEAVVFAIADTKGAGVPIDTLSHYKGEKEVLFNPGAEFAVTSITKDKHKHSPWVVSLVTA